ncbi:GIY-YIG nuclease family protein [Providencia rettgeri]
MKNKMTVMGQGFAHPEIKLSDINTINLEHINKCVMPENLQGGFVYVAKSSIGLVKVGKTRNVPARMKQLSSGSGIFITDVFCTSAEQYYSEIEMRSHHLLSSYSQAGEWFSADFDMVKQVVQKVAKKLHNELLPRIKKNPYNVYLWLCANEEQDKFESVLIDILSDDSKAFLHGLGVNVTAYIANCIHSMGTIILHNKNTAHVIYPNGYVNTELSALKAEWGQIESEGVKTDESDFMELLLDISDMPAFLEEVEFWRNRSVSKYFYSLLNIERQELAQRVEVAQ